MTAADLMRRIAKAALLPYGAVARERRPGVLILGYHRVGAGTGQELDLPVELFAWQMAYLREHFTVVSLDQVVRLRGAPLERDVVTVTFDDGYEDVYRQAFPILSRYQLPATIYLTTGLVAHGGPTGATSASSAQGLTWAQIEAMVASGLVTIGAHTHTHADLSLVGPAEVAAELALANGLITDRLGAAPIHFAYPWGRVGPAAREAVAALYVTAAIGGSAKNAYAALNPHALKRIPIQRSDGRAFFRLKLGSYLVGEEWLRGAADTRRRVPGSPPVPSPEAGART